MFLWQITLYTEFVKTHSLQQCLQIQKASVYILRILKKFRKSDQVHILLLLLLLYRVNCEEKQTLIIMIFEQKDYDYFV